MSRLPPCHLSRSSAWPPPQPLPQPPPQPPVVDPEETSRATTQSQRYNCWGLARVRTRHCKNPTRAFVLIPDRARRLYRIPNHPRFASRPCLEIKLLGAIVHGQCVVLNFVPKTICDDANVNATVLLLVLMLLSDQREAQEKGRQLPPKIHVQVDGASTNWCKTMFAFIGFLVMPLICIEAIYARSPVGKGPPHDGAFTVDAYSANAGNTHEDIDGLYGIYAQELEKESCDTPEEFEAAEDAREESIRELDNRHPQFRQIL